MIRRIARTALTLAALVTTLVVTSIPEVWSLPHDVDVLYASINRTRHDYGLALLERSTHLHQEARHWSLWMARNHKLKDPPLHCAGAANVGVTTRWQPHAALRLAAAFLDSPEHRHNILLPWTSRVGIAVVRRGAYVWATEIFCD